MKEPLFLCTKNDIFLLTAKYFSVAMESPLGPVIAEIFMVELEKSLIPTLIEHMSPWKRYVDDTIAVIKLSSIKYMYCQFSTAFTKILNFHMSWNKMVRLFFRRYVNYNE